MEKINREQFIEILGNFTFIGSFRPSALLEEMLEIKFNDAYAYIAKLNNMTIILTQHSQKIGVVEVWKLMK